jgi:hypothetical protein
MNNEQIINKLETDFINEEDRIIDKETGDTYFAISAINQFMREARIQERTDIIKELEDEQLKLGYRLGSKHNKKIDTYKSGRDVGMVVGFDDALKIVKHVSHVARGIL